MAAVNGVVEKIKAFPQKLGKLKYPALILLLGLMLMLLPERTAKTPAEETQPAESEPSLAIEERRLETLLSKVQGAGTVEVMLSLKSGESVAYQTDTSLQTQNGEQESARQESTTVLRSAGSGSQQPLVRQVDGPVYLGAIILCQGADSPGVRLALVEAVSSITGLGADQITVVKMK